MARPKKSILVSTGKIGKEQIKNRQEQEEKIKVGREGLERGAPEWLDEEAAEEFSRVVSEARAIDLFDNLDLSILAIISCHSSKSHSEALYLVHGSKGSIQKLPAVRRSLCPCSDRKRFVPCLHGQPV